MTSVNSNWSLVLHGFCVHVVVWEIGHGRACCRYVECPISVTLILAPCSFTLSKEPITDPVPMNEFLQGVLLCYPTHLS